MSYEIRAMSLGEVLDTGFRLLRDHFTLLMGIALILSIVAEALAVSMDSLEVGSDAGAGMSALLLAILFAIISPVVAVAITYAVSELYLGRPVSISDAYRVGGRLLLKVIGTGFLMLLLVAVGLLLLVFPGLYLMFAFMLTYQVMVMEGSAGFRALERSRELASGNLLRILGVFLVVMLVGSVVGVVVELTLAQIPVLDFIGSALVQAATSAYMYATFVVLYFDIRCRKEAFDLEHLAGVVEARSPAPAPAPAIG